MPDETEVWAVPAHIGTSPPYKSDMRFRNMKLNARLLGRKSRERKLMLPCDSPFQKRNLTKYPMEYSHMESRKNADGQHIVRKITAEKVKKAQVDSENLRQYSLKMFDNAVDVYTHRNDQRNVLSEIPSRIMSGHNGPTHNGSVLYNKRSNIMNSIRLRSQSEIPTRFNHLKSQTIQPQIKQTLCRSNREYTVSCVSPKVQSARSVSTISNNSEFRLIPNGSMCSEELDWVKSEMNDSVFDDNENCSNTSSSVSMDPSFLKRNLPSAKLHFYSIEEDSSSEEDLNVTDAVPTEEPKKDLIPEPQPETSRPKSGKGRPKSGRSKSSASPKSKAKRGKSPKSKKGKDKESVPVTPPPQPEVKVIETPPVRKPLKGPKCWVDDATITSEKEILNDDENISQTSKPGSPTCKSPAKSNVSFKNQGESPDIDNVQTLPEPVKKEQCLVLEEVEQYIPNGLPSFICPSSEERSRQEAIKDWLAGCNFGSASRCVPLL
ncbi:uncharacterized protein LOC127705681 isoform X1 [Mytilus californianus]|uniref:uncharacterized protein LOC127705681 isoform X1 n=2 Tax=Mytilus californianus TaxID=6549 RepID=UPI002245E1B6|nr:uncharacterized protein LOC127705681 isoform X1 [Mytilus californianus]